MAGPTIYDGRTAAINIAGNVSALIVPAIANQTLKTCTVVEVGAGTRVDCNIREINISGSVSDREEQFLCDTEVSKSAGSVSYSMDPIVIQAGNPQVANTFLDTLVRGSTVYIVERYGLAADAAWAALQRVRITKCEVALVEDMPVAANADANKFEVRVHLSVRKHERNATISA